MARHGQLPRALEAHNQAPNIVGGGVSYPSLRVERGRLLVPVRVVSPASQIALSLESDGLRVRLSAPPVGGAANAALVTLLAERLGLPRSAAARHKLVAIEGLTPDELWRRLGV
jgi:uncharacterized protein YggU (UPF0235/DUF167 family)